MDKISKHFSAQKGAKFFLFEYKSMGRREDSIEGKFLNVLYEQIFVLYTF